MSAEATNPATPGPVTPGAHRRRGRPRIDLRRIGWAALLGPAAGNRLPDAIGHVVEAHRAHHPEAPLSRCAGRTSSPSPPTGDRCARAASPTSHTPSP